MTNSSTLQETILKAIDAVVTQRNNELKLDKTITGIVKKNIGKRGNKSIYQIEYAGGIIEAVTQKADDMYSPYTNVYVLVPEGDFSKEKIIIGRGSTIQTDRTASVVAAAVNKYSIVGANLLESTSSEKIKDIKYGLRSFHPEFRDKSHGIDHRAQFIYLYKDESNKINFNNDRFSKYKEETTAIMIKADFLTNLDIIQKTQPNARYGLIFNFAFDNLNKGYGETNKEVLDNISKIVKGNIIKVENGKATQKNDEFLFDCLSNEFFSKLNNDSENINNFIKDNEGYLDKTIDITKAIYNSFKVDHAKLDKEIIANTITAFLNLLNELKQLKNLEDLKNQWKEWCAEVIGEAEEKNVQFVLTSDDMIGNPFSFNTWNTQYSVFNIDLDTFNHLDSILFYKEGFVVDTEKTNYESQWPIGETGGGPDIFVKNLQIYAMNPLDNQSGDYTLKVEAYNSNDIILSEEYKNTQFKATLMRKLYEDLTANAKVNYFWFKEDSSVINTNSANYHYLGGSGWRNLEHKETNYLFSTSLEDNPAYKNNYKCVAVYEPSQDDKTILSYVFSVYNADAAYDVKLESDLGERFSFDAGAPTVTVLVNKDRISGENNFEEINAVDENGNSIFKYCWTIEDSANNYTLFLDEVIPEGNLYIEEGMEVKDAMLYTAKKGLLQKIKKYIYNTETKQIVETDQSDIATRVKYPVSIASSGFTITCYVKKLGANNLYYDIGSASLKFMNQTESIVADYRVHIINGDQVFQYDEYGNTPKAKKNKNPLVIKPLQAKLFDRSGIEIQGANYKVEWIFPIEATMIIAKEPLIENPSTKLIQSFIGYELDFDIAELYDPNAYANQITCHIEFGGEHYYKDTNFYFGKQGSNGTNGTDVVAKIEYHGEDFSNILHYQPLTLYVQNEQGKFNVDTNGLQNSLLLNAENRLKLAVYQKGELLSDELYGTGFPKWNIAGNAKALINDIGRFFELVAPSSENNDGNNNVLSRTTESYLKWSYNYNYNQNTEDNYYYRMQNIKASVKLKYHEDNKTNTSEDNENNTETTENNENTEILDTTTNKDKEQTYYAFLSLPIIEYESFEDNNKTIDNILLSNIIAIDRNYYLNEIVYNADGRNPIYNHKQGLKLYNIPDEVKKIVWTACGGFVKDENEPCFSLINITTEEKTNADGEIVKEKKTSNPSKTFDSESVPIVDGQSMIYVLPDDTYNGSITNNYIKAECYSVDKDNNDVLYATVYAPINMTLNTFGLTSLNAWDGNTVTIDEDGGYIMAPQIGAGEKDNNNRFTGILMGKTETYTGYGKRTDKEHEELKENEKEVGLFGYSHGLQSIFLDSNTGNATFGLPEGYIFDTTTDTLVPQKSKDNYNEGRIELRPGGVSKIGGWRLGRRSIYYTTKPKENQSNINEKYEYEYDGTIGEKYEGDISTPGNKEYAAHHEKDIKTQDGGLLLSAEPPYISIKGKKLAIKEIDSGLNSQLDEGDSLEIQLDPQTPTLFTIFRHNSTNRESNANKRVYLAGINDKGELLSNAVGKEDGAGAGAKTGIMPLKAFEDTKESEPSYIGAIFEAGTSVASTRTFFQIFREKTHPLSYDAPVYLTGGQVSSSGDFKDGADGNEYLRSISIHGKDLALYAKNYSAPYNKPITDANIKIAQNDAQIQLGSLTQLSLQRSSDEENILKTAGNFNWNIGKFEESNNENSLLSYFKNSNANITNAKKLIIQNKDFEQYNYGNVDIRVKNNYTVDSYSEGSSDDFIRFRLLDKKDKKHSFLRLQPEKVWLGVHGERSDVDTKSIITMGSSEEIPSSWEMQNNPLEISTHSKAITTSLDSSKPFPIRIMSYGVGSGVTVNSDTNPQITIMAGNEKPIDTTPKCFTKMTFSTSDDSWVTGSHNTGSKITGGYYDYDGIPFEVQFGFSQPDGSSQNDASFGVRTNVITSTTPPTRFNTFVVSMNERIHGGLVVTSGINGEIDTEWNSSNIKDTSKYGIWSVYDIHTEQEAVGINFKNSSYSKSEAGYTYTADGQTLADLIEDCLYAAAQARSAAADAQATADSAVTAAANAQTTANNAATAAANAQVTANGKADKGNYTITWTSGSEYYLTGAASADGKISNQYSVGSYLSGQITI